MAYKLVIDVLRQMSDPHNKQRYGEVWPEYRISYGLAVLEAIKNVVVISGGWAWHFMSPPHVELKHAHDHKDIDLFVHPHEVTLAISKLKEAGFEKVWTRYDKLPSDEDFRRYEKTVNLPEGKTHRITVDFFVRNVPFIVCRGGFRVVEPKTLLSFYSNIHSSDKCFAVQAATRLLEAGIDPVGRPELITIPA